MKQLTLKLRGTEQAGAVIEHEYEDDDNYAVLIIGDGVFPEEVAPPTITVSWEEGT